MGTLNAKITMKAMVANDLDLTTGVSSVVSMRKLEKLTGLRQVSNGAKIIREDAVPFNKFQIIRQYDSDTLELRSVKFNGYRTIAYQRKVVSERIKKRKEKMKTLQSLMDKDVVELMSLYERMETQDENTPLFGVGDISPTFLE